MVLKWVRPIKNGVKVTGPISSSAVLPLVGFVDSEEPGHTMCRPCDVECAIGCRGPTNGDCISADMQTDISDMGCKNRVFLQDNGFYVCLPECPIGYYPTTVNGIETCYECHEACSECGDNIGSEESDSPYGYKQCTGTKCADGYYKLDAGVGNIQCLVECPEGKHCIKYSLCWNSHLKIQYSISHQLN